MVEKRFEPEYHQEVHEVHSQQQQPQANTFDYRNFFDFGFFSNAAASFGGQVQPHQNAQTYYTSKQVSPHSVILKKEVVSEPQPQDDTDYEVSGHLNFNFVYAFGLSFQKFILMGFISTLSLFSQFHNISTCFASPPSIFEGFTKVNNYRFISRNVTDLKQELREPLMPAL